MNTAIITCICNKEHTLKNGRSKKCRCGVVLSLRGDTPFATIPENSLDERRRNGKPVVNETPKGRWA